MQFIDYEADESHEESSNQGPPEDSKSNSSFKYDDESGDEKSKQDSENSRDSTSRESVVKQESDDEVEFVEEVKIKKKKYKTEKDIPTLPNKIDCGSDGDNEYDLNDPYIDNTQYSDDEKAHAKLNNMRKKWKKDSKEKNPKEIKEMDTLKNKINELESKKTKPKPVVAAVFKKEDSKKEVKKKEVKKEVKKKKAVKKPAFFECEPNDAMPVKKKTQHSLLDYFKNK